MKTNFIKLMSVISILQLLFSCKDFSDLTIKIKTEPIEIYSSYIQIAVVGKEQINGEVKIEYEGQLLYSKIMESNKNTTFEKCKLNFHDLGDNLIGLSSDIIEKSEIELNIQFINTEEKVKIEERFKVKTIIPPLNKIILLEGDGFERTPIEVSKKELLLAKKQNVDKRIIDKVALLAYLIGNETRVLEFKDKYDLVIFDKILEPKEMVKIKILADTAYLNTFIARYPLTNNEFYNKDIESYIQDNLATIIEDVDNNFIKVENGNYTFEREIKAFYNGRNGLYFINIDETGNYLIQKFGEFIVDNSAPQFYQQYYCSFSGNGQIEGLVCLSHRDFFGYNPYSVPFVGHAHGDIKEIYVKGQRISFEIGKDIYFKKKLYLDGGYNRIPVKIVDKRGNSTEGYISITIEQMDDNSIDIHNFHY